jgi:hypothetical protein
MLRLDAFPGTLKPRLGRGVTWSCLALGADYLAVGTNNGSIYMYTRFPTLVLRQIMPVRDSKDDTKIGLVKLKFQPSNDSMLAVARADGSVLVLKCDYDNHKKPVTVKHRIDQHTSAVTTIAWGEGPTVVYSGDAAGSVYRTRLFDFSMSCGKLLESTSAIVQLAVERDTVLVSTLTHALVLHCKGHEVTCNRVGTKERNGPYGICFDPRSKISPRVEGDSKLGYSRLFAARPGRRLWNCTVEDGQVEATLKLALPATRSAFSPYEHPESAEQQAVKRSKPQFSELHPFLDQILATSRDRNSLLVLDPTHVEVSSWTTALTGVVDVAVQRNLCVVLHVNQAASTADSVITDITRLSSVPHYMYLGKALLAFKKQLAEADGKSAHRETHIKAVFEHISFLFTHQLTQFSVVSLLYSILDKLLPSALHDLREQLRVSEEKKKQQQEQEQEEQQALQDQQLAAAVAAAEEAERKQALEVQKASISSAPVEPEVQQAPANPFAMAVVSPEEDLDATNPLNDSNASLPDPTTVAVTGKAAMNILDKIEEEEAAAAAEASQQVEAVVSGELTQQQLDVVQKFFLFYLTTLHRKREKESRKQAHVASQMRRTVVSPRQDLSSFLNLFDVDIDTQMAQRTQEVKLTQNRSRLASAPLPQTPHQGDNKSKSTVRADMSRNNSGSFLASLTSKIFKPSAEEGQEAPEASGGGLLQKLDDLFSPTNSSDPGPRERFASNSSGPPVAPPVAHPVSPLAVPVTPITRDPSSAGPVTPAYSTPAEYSTSAVYASLMASTPAEEVVTPRDAVSPTFDSSSSDEDLDLEDYEGFDTLPPEPSATPYVPTEVEPVSRRSSTVKDAEIAEPDYDLEEEDADLDDLDLEVQPAATDMFFDPLNAAATNHAIAKKRPVPEKKPKVTAPTPTTAVLAEEEDSGLDFGGPADGEASLFGGYQSKHPKPAAKRIKDKKQKIQNPFLLGQKRPSGPMDLRSSMELLKADAPLSDDDTSDGSDDDISAFAKDIFTM